MRKVLMKLKMRWGDFNKVVFLLTLSDVFTWGPYTIISSLAGIYLSTKLGENVVEVVGIGLGIYYLTRAVLPIPVGVISDKLKRDRDEIAFLLAGVILMGVPFIFFPRISQSIQYYFLQFLFGVGTALNLTNWRKLFAKNLREDREGWEYSVYEMTISLTTAAFSAIAGVVANINQDYFDFVMSGVGFLMMGAGIWVLLIYFVKERKSA